MDLDRSERQDVDLSVVYDFRDSGRRVVTEASTATRRGELRLNLVTQSLLMGDWKTNRECDAYHLTPSRSDRESPA